MDTAWIQQTFLDLVQIDSHSLQEGSMAERCRRELEAMGFTVVEDHAGQALNGECGNLVATLPGDPSWPTLLLAAHMDTVQPGQGVRPQVDDEGVVWSSGDTVLGADDKAGVTAILAAMRALVESGRPHGTIQVLFTIAEEIGLQGAKNLDRSLLQAQLGLSLDSSGPLGTLIVAAPAQVRWEAAVLGRKAHAGVAPEKGISAIKVAAQAVARMPHGRIDKETTVNIGSFVGEGPTNIVADTARLVGEARSRDPEKLTAVVDRIKAAFEETTQEFGASVEFSHRQMYGALRFDPDAPVRQRAEQALAACGFTVRPTEGGGGSDANVITGYGVPTINIGIGYEEIHSTQEHIRIKDIASAAEVALAFCTLA
ncbi:MAG: M20/M25/M40 family metallo-hydrolase [Alicyclobacillus sp.]|nr:M20/M25/M40 family metallo-hydrolase [Alicyclobacillus sp.]